MGRRVLIADANVDAADSLALLLQLCGHEVATARSGPDALTLARDFHPEAVFLSIQLTGLNGYEVCRRLRAEANDAAVLLVALTGYGQDDDRRACREAGFDHHLIKPADPGQILALLG